MQTEIICKECRHVYYAESASMIICPMCGEPHSVIVVADDKNQIVDVNKKVNARGRYLAFKAEADEHFGGLGKAITEHVEGLEEIRKIDNQIITNLSDDCSKLRQRIEELEDKDQLLTDLNEFLEEQSNNFRKEWGEVIQQLERDKNELLAAIIGYRTGQISDRAFDMLIEKHRRV